MREPDGGVRSAAGVGAAAVARTGWSPALVGADETTPPAVGGAATQQAAEAGRQAAVEAAPQAAMEAGPRVAAEAGPQAAVEAGPQAPMVVDSQAAAEAGPGAAADAAPQAAVEAAPQAAMEAGPRVAARAAPRPTPKRTGAASGRVWLVGAGPGDPDLVTVRGRDCLGQADVVVYDRLADTALLGACRADAERVYVGKGPGAHTLEQDGINRLLVERARSGLRVVRLKGGDPFVFGRGGEEALALAAAGVPFEVVPGVTSAIAVPAFAGIPVTHRDASSSFAVVTGHERPGRPSARVDWAALARSVDTLVVLMGVGRLAEIAAALTAGGLAPDSPAAVIAWGTTPRQRTVVAPLGDIAAAAAQGAIVNPAVLVVGEAVRLRRDLTWFEARPLFGRRILVTRSRDRAGTLSAAIRARGGEAVEVPTIVTLPAEDGVPLRRGVDGLARGAYGWLCFTSASAVDAVFAALRSSGGDARSLAGVRVAVVGPATAERLAREGIRADVVARAGSAAGLAADLSRLVAPGDRVLFPAADIAGGDLPDGLRGLGARVDQVTAYRTAPHPEARQRVARLLDEGCDAVTFASSSAVATFVAAAGPEGAEACARAPVVCIGPATASAARAARLPVAAVAAVPTVEALADAVCGLWGAGNREGGVSR